MKTKIFSILCLSFLILTVDLKAQEGWFTLFTENDTSTFYTGLKFVNANTGYLTSSWGNANNNGGFTLKSINGGFNWFAVETGVSRYGLFFLNEQTGWTFGGYWEGSSKKSREVFRTTNAGVNFTRIYLDSLTASFKNMFFIDALTGWIITTQNVIKTTNSGVNWSVSSALSFNSIYFINANTGWGVTATGIIYHSTDGGLNWGFQLTASGNAFTRLIFKNPNTGWVCGAPPNVYKTTNSGLSWTPYSSGITVLMSAIDFADTLNGWICSNAGEISHTTNGGINWTLQTTVTGFMLTELTFPNQYTGYVIGSSLNPHNNKLLKTTTGGTVFVQNISTEIPKNFSLSQNYPNPFNPITKIKFDIPPSKGARGMIQVIIYDILGREIATLVNEELNPGTYEVKWDGSNYPSGVYFNKLITTDYSETRKMVLLK